MVALTAGFVGALSLSPNAGAVIPVTVIELISVGVDAAVLLKVISTVTFESVRPLTVGADLAPVGVFETLTVLANLLAVVSFIVTSKDALYSVSATNFPLVKLGVQLTVPFSKAEALASDREIMGSPSPVAGAFETETPKEEISVVSAAVLLKVISTVTFESVRPLTAGADLAPVGVFEALTVLANLLAVVSFIVTSKDALYSVSATNFPLVKLGVQLTVPFSNAEAFAPDREIVGSTSPVAGAFDTETSKEEISVFSAGG